MNRKRWFSWQGLERAFDGCLRLSAAGLLTSMLIAALHDVSRGWDIWSYHLPFAARIAGVVSPEKFVFHAADEARFVGFPLLGETLQGWLWRATQRAESANLVAFLAVPVVAAFLRSCFAVPFHLTVLALLAVPLVQIHATSCYVDLPANAAVSILVLLTLRAYASPNVPSLRASLLAFLAAAFAANTKLLLHPVVFAALTAFCMRCVLCAPAARRRLRILVMVALFPIVFASPIKNLALHHNPYYPVRFSVAGLVFDGPEAPYFASPQWLSHASRPVRFAASILEIGVRPMTDRRRWTIDQWTPLEAKGYRMGGYFGAYVAAQLALLLVQAFKAKTRESRVGVFGFAGLTLLTAGMPQSHELRYYMHWIIVLVSVNLWLAVRQGNHKPAPHYVASGAPTPLALLVVVSVLALVQVLRVTRASYVYPSGSTFVELVREQTDAQRIAAVPERATACVAREPYNLLWAAPFHPPRNYRLKEVEVPSECGSLPRF